MKFCLHLIIWGKKPRMCENSYVLKMSVTGSLYIAGGSVNCYNCFGKQTLSPVPEYSMPKYISTAEHMYKNIYRNNS